MIIELENKFYVFVRLYPSHLSPHIAILRSSRSVTIAASFSLHEYAVFLWPILDQHTTTQALFLIFVRCCSRIFLFRWSFREEIPLEETLRNSLISGVFSVGFSGYTVSVRRTTVSPAECPSPVNWFVLQVSWLEKNTLGDSPNCRIVHSYAIHPSFFMFECFFIQYFSYLKKKLFIFLNFHFFIFFYILNFLIFWYFFIFNIIYISLYFYVFCIFHVFLHFFELWYFFCIIEKNGVCWFFFSKH